MRLAIIPLVLIAIGSAGISRGQTKLVGWGPTFFDSSFSEESFVQADAGGYFSIARRADGSLAAFGLGADDISGSFPIPAGAIVVDARAGNGTAILLYSNGTARLLPSGSLYAPLSPIVQISVSAGHTLVLLANGQINTFGDNTYGQMNVPPLPGGMTYVEVSAGFQHSIARRSDGQIVSWGSITQGAVPTAGLSFTQISAGYLHNAALLSDGSVFAWGSNNWHQLDVLPLPLGITYTKIDCGVDDTLALRSDGSAVGWGDNSRGQTSVPPLPPGMTYVGVSAGGVGITAHFSHSVALRSDGRVIGFGFNAYAQTGVPPLSAGTSWSHASASGTPPDGGGAVAFPHVAALRTDGTIVTFGDTDRGQNLVPALPAGLSYSKVSAGGAHDVAVRSDGNIVGWGDNGWGQLNGIPSLPPGTTYVDVSASGYYTLALRSDGAVVQWNGGPAFTPPVLPAGLTYVSIAAGLSHALALRSDGTIAAWGQAGSGQLNVPPLPPGVRYVEIAADDYHSLARRSDGTVAGWGYAPWGGVDAPALPAGMSYVHVATSHFCSIALRNDGQLVMWGQFPQGEQNVPTLAPGERFVEITPGAMGIVALVDRVWTTYGTGKTNSLGCVPQIGAVGTPGVSQPSGFEVRCTQLRNQTLGMLIYTVNGARAAVPFQCGTLLVGPTGIRRSPIRGSGGSSFPATDCSGVFALDMNAYAAGAAGGMPDPALSVPGNVVRAQWWGRDNGFAPPCNTTLSNAIEYTTRP